MIIVFFIIICTAATLHASGLTNISDAGEAAKALVPLAGKWAGLMFAFGLLNASLFAATILPLSTAHVICEGMGFEAGIDHKFREAPAFYWLYTILILAGAGIVMIPKVPLWKSVAADCGDLYFTAGQPEGFDGGTYKYSCV
jgi:Mn2+/Fe2+ NRAMP family transporter